MLFNSEQCHSKDQWGAMNKQMQKVSSQNELIVCGEAVAV